MATLPAIPEFFNTTITVLRTADGSGNACDGKYNVVYGNPKVTDRSANAIFNYQLADPTPKEIRFTGMRVEGETGTHQLSEPTISVDGRMITFSDANTETVLMNLTFKWRDCIEFEHDPQVGNIPPT